MNYKKSAEGSFDYYLDLGEDSGFFKNITRAVIRADNHNKILLGTVFPGLVAANMHDRWEERPSIEYSILENMEPEMEPSFSKPSKVPVQGCFLRYLYFSGDFVTCLARSIVYADKDNLRSIHIAYPQMVEAFMNDNWNVPPDWFERDEYNSRKRDVEI